MSSLAPAAASSGAGLGNLLIFALPILLIAFMFMTQRRRQREVQAVQSGLKVGDEVTTTSGLLGRISAIDDTVVTLEVSPGVLVRFDRRAIGGPAPAAATSSPEAAASEPAEARTETPAETPADVPAEGSTPAERPDTTGERD
ncbi:preprotein translocase subunit YajC [Oryzihumus leptocrescens]|uniref:Protein translocase subunit yajC n=1 Tax=Oryzihumus leptocrescens TaxID=297536 RepID=A0A542ZJ64_9MICO|nr:preprotein translocase subunit YajC [Oryzihumus leptocrescens]TQL60385.1 protein translocase subunit yajC [Oryzihumus leptocrescens]